MEKALFSAQLKRFAATLKDFIVTDDEWTIRGFIDLFKNIYTISSQNWYPDLTFISKSNPQIKFAVDLKTTYRDEEYPGFCNGFTLGSHGEYFIDRTSTKNIQYPYDAYSGHFCLGIIYTRTVLDKNDETRVYSIKEIADIPAVIRDFLFFAEEKWKIASDKSGSGNTANIGSIQKSTTY